MLNSSPAKPLMALPMEEFLKRLASDAPTPGGGSVSAYAGAMAGALVSMVGTLTQGKQMPSGDEFDGMEILIEQGHQIAQTLSEAVDRDSAAFDAVMAAFKLPKDTDEAKAARSVAIQAATKHAAEVPLEVARECLAAAELAFVALDQGNPNCASDAGVAGILAVAGLEGAILNVAINLGSIKDSEWVAAKRTECEQLLERRREIRSSLEVRLKVAIPGMEGLLTL